MAGGKGLAVHGIEERIAELAAMAKRVDTLKPVLEVQAVALVKFIDDRFDTSTDPQGIAWEELAEATLANRRGDDAKILVDTARLRNSIHALASDDGIRWGASVVYAEYHQLGTEHVPERRFLPVKQVGDAWVIDTEGPAGELWRETIDAIERYIRTGKVE